MNTTRTWKKVLSILLALALLLSAAPVGNYMDVNTHAAATDRIIYLNTGGSSMWNQANAWFSAWAWPDNGSGSWYKGTDSNSDGIYEFTVPTTVNNIIFLRKDPSSTSDDWNCWNRTYDLTIGSNNCYTITGWTSNEYCNGSWSTQTHSVSFSGLTNITSNGSTTATSGSAYSATLTASTGYTLPSSITVKVGSTTLTSGTDYTYSSSTGALTIYGTSVTGDITISGSGVAKTYNVTFSLTNVTKSSGNATATHGTSYTAKLAASSGYTLPTSITVKVGNSTLSTSNYTYSSSTGSITIKAASVTGAITITAAGEEIPASTYSVTLSGTGVSMTGASTVTESTQYTTTLSADTGYSLPSSITVKAGSTTLKSGTGYSYNSSTGALTIYAAYVTGNITITANATANSYNVTFSLTNLTKSSGNSTATYGTNYTAKFTANTGYTLPSSITVKCGTTTLTKGTHYTYSSGTVTITGTYITGNITITASGTLNTYAVTYSLTNVTKSSGATTVSHGSSYSATLAGASGYSLPASITVKRGSTTLTSGTDYTYNSSTGALTIAASATTGALTITAAGVKIYTVAGTADLCNTAWDPTQNPMTLNSDGTYSITFSNVPAGNHSFKVTDGSWANSWGGSGTDGNYEFTLSVKSDVTITFNPSTGSISVEYEELVASYTVTFSCTNVTGSGDSKAYNGVAYTATLTAASGYHLPASITVKRGSTTLSTSYYSYDSSTGVVTITGSAITGNITITAVGEEDYYMVVGESGIAGSNWDTTDLDNVMTKNSDGTYSITYTNVPAGTYELKCIKNGSYDAGQWPSSGNKSFTISAMSNVTVTLNLSNHTVTITTSTASVKVTLNGTNVTISGNSTATAGSDYTATLTKKSGYELPASVTVTINGTTVTSGYTYDRSTGKVVISGSAITGDIVISATGVVSRTVTFNGTNVTSNGASTASNAADYTATLTPANGYQLPETITVKRGSSTLSTSSYTYDSATGKLTIPAAQITGNITITAEGVEDSYIIAGSEGLTGSSWSTTDTNNQMTKNADGTYTIVYSTVPAGSYEFKVTKNGDWLWPAENYVLDLTLPSNVTITYDPSTGTGSVSIEKLAIPEQYDRMDEKTLSADSTFYADVDIVDYLNDERVGNNQVKGYYTNNQGIWNSNGDSPYSYLNDLISQQAYYGHYTYPMYFGPLNYIASRYSRIVGSETTYALGKWHSAINTAMAANDGNGTINTDAAVQGLVGNRLVDGNLVDPATGSTLLYFNKEAADSWTNQGGQYPVMAYYENLKFPFKMTYDAENRVTTYSYDSASDYAVYYDYTNNQLYASDTHILDSVNDGNSSSSDYGFYPLNEPDDQDNEVNNGFGVKFSIDFTVSEDGLLANGQPVAFDFTGDDDVWVFIDGVLVLDMGGAHAKASGRINFAEKTATVNDAYTISSTGALTSGDSYSASAYAGKSYSYLYNYTNGVATEERAAVASAESVKSFESLGLSDFDYSAIHTMTVFYVERGMVESNFSMEFTMVPVPSGLTLSKELNSADINAGLLDEISGVSDYNFILSATSPSSTTSVAFQNFTLTEKNTGMATVMTPKGSTSGRKYTATITGITNYTYAHSFFTSAGEHAFIPGTAFTIEESTNSIFQYSGTKWAVYDAKNGYQPITNGTGTGSTATFTMGSADDNTAYSYAVTFTNTMELGSLQISKIFNDSALADTQFVFQVYLDLDGSKSNFTEQLYSKLVYSVDGGTPITSNDGTITIKGGQTATISGIPAGATYRVVEVVSEDDPWTLTSSSNATGTITTNGTQTATFTNTVKSNTMDKVIYVEAGKATAYTPLYNGSTFTFTGVSNVSDGLTVSYNGSSITATGAEANKAYTVKYTGRLSNSEIVTGTITVYTFAATNKVYVFDFGLSSNLAITNTNGDGLFQGGCFDNTSVSGESAILKTLTGNGNVQTTITATLNKAVTAYGASYAVTFQPVAFMSKVETYTYTVQITANGKTFVAGDPETGTTLTGTIKVMPANAVYYEDNFNATGSNDAANKIIFSGNAPSTNPTLTQSNDQSLNYGYDEAYIHRDGYNAYAQSAGSATTLNCTYAEENDKGEAVIVDGDYAYFTFTGTGFDLISQTNAASAGFAVYVFTDSHKDEYINYMTTFSGATPADLVFVDTYYNNGDLYQVPVVSVRLSSYRQYTVYIQALNTAPQRKTVSIDAIRIYNPLGSNADYPLTAEQNTTVDELRVLYGEKEIVHLAGRTGDANNSYVFSGLGKQSIVEQALKNASIIEDMDGDEILTAADVDSIYMYGPNNEMYLPTNFGISFSYKVNSADWTLQLGAKAVSADGTAKSITVYARTSGKGTYEPVATITLSSATDMYYDLTDYLGSYSSVGSAYDIIIISNSTHATNEFVSLTTVKHSSITLS
ncbi:MAG: fibro-slime domain-containing protein [Oscillospiraceae bacterium]|nr:fibro-slime domain-containing protein [Oscillospiraceae bacterium]